MLHSISYIARKIDTRRFSVVNLTAFSYLLAQFMYRDDNIGLLISSTLPFSSLLVWVCKVNRMALLTAEVVLS